MRRRDSDKMIGKGERERRGRERGRERGERGEGKGGEGRARGDLVWEPAEQE